LALDRYFHENNLLINNTEKKPKEYWVTHLPYISNCKPDDDKFPSYGSFIDFNMLLKDSCDTVSDPKDVTFSNPFISFKGDYCEYKATCLYDE